MLKFSEIIGLPVVSIASGYKIGTVKDIIFISDTKEISALIIHENRKLMSSPQAIKVQDVIKVGKSAVLVSEEQCLTDLKSFLSSTEFVKQYSKEVKEKRVYTDGGVKLGTIQDALFDFETGMLAEFEISDGLVQDLIEGRKIMPATESIQLEQGIIIVESEKIHQLKDNHKGLKNFFSEREE